MCTNAGGIGRVSGAGSVADRAISQAMSPLKDDKTGANFKSLPYAFKENIRKNLVISETFQEAIRNGNPNKMTEEWTAGLRGISDKRKVIIGFSDGKIQYTVKKGNKILLKTNSKEQTANKIAQFYNDHLRK